MLFVAVLQELQLKHQAVDAFREMAAVLEEQLRLDDHEHRSATSSDLQKYELLLLVHSSQLVDVNRFR